MFAGRLALIGAVALLAGACGDDDEVGTVTVLDDDTITVGSFNFPESVLLAEIYSQALEQQGIDVERAFGLGPREFVGPAMRLGLIELLPEYAGTALGFVSAGAAEGTADPAATYLALERALAGTGVVALAPAPAQNANTFAVRREIAERFDLQQLSDLGPVAGRLTFGGPPECPQRPLCLGGLRETYELRFGNVMSVDTGAPTQQALDDGSVDVALLFTTDPALGEYVELDDDLGLQPAENVTPLVREEAIARWGTDLTAAVDGVSGALSTETLRELNAADARQPGTEDVAGIAASWLEAEGS